jgi:hypothetical protein
MLILWLLKLYWIWIILGLIILVPSVPPFGFSIMGMLIGGILTLWGLVARKAMSSDSFRDRIERNLK